MSEPGKRHLKYRGKEATVVNFSVLSTDEYGDRSFKETTESTHVQIMRSPGDYPQIRQTAGGQDVQPIAAIWLPDDVTVSDGEDADQPSEIRVDGEAYEVQMVDDYGNGVIRTLCQRV